MGVNWINLVCLHCVPEFPLPFVTLQIQYHKKTKRLPISTQIRAVHFSNLSREYNFNPRPFKSWKLFSIYPPISMSRVINSYNECVPSQRLVALFYHIMMLKGSKGRIAIWSSLSEVSPRRFWKVTIFWLLIEHFANDNLRCVILTNFKCRMLFALAFTMASKQSFCIELYVLWVSTMEMNSGYWSNPLSNWMKYFKGGARNKRLS